MFKLLFIVIAGTLVYFLLKLCLYLYRPFFLSKTFRQIEQMYDNLLTAADKDIGSAAEDFKAWQSGDRVIKTFNSEDEMIERINTAKTAKAHEEELHEKFLRLRERFIGDLKKTSESIEAYRRYLVVKLKQRQEAALFASAVISGAMSFDEMSAAAKATMIVLEENERKLDILLITGDSNLH